MSDLFPPTGRNARFVVTCEGKDFAGFDTEAEANAYVYMQKDKKAGGGSMPAAAAKMNWGIRSS